MPPRPTDPLRAMITVVLAATASLLTSLVGPAAPAGGTVPAAATSTGAAHAVHAGHDGRIAFVRDDQIYSMNRWGAGSSS